MNISVSGVSYAVDGKCILDNVDLELVGGKTTILLGPNGAGKSTLLRLITGFLNADSGSVDINGASPAGMLLTDKAKLLGVLTQNITLDFPFTAREVIAMGRTPFGISDGFDVVTQQLIGQFGITAEQSYLTMSGGEKQLVQLCRVFAQVWNRGGDAFLLLDEPMTALDLKHQARVATQLRRFADEGLGQLIVMHDINLAAEIADEIVLMTGGSIVASGPAEQVLQVDNLQRTFDTAIAETGSGADRHFRAEIGK